MEYTNYTSVKLIKEKGNEKPQNRLSSVQTGRALHKLDNLVDEINEVVKEFVRTQIQ